MKILLAAAFSAIGILALILGLFNFNKGVSEAHFLSKISSAMTFPLAELKSHNNPQLRLDNSGQEIANVIIMHCNLSFPKKLQQVAADANYSRALSSVKIPGGLTLDDINTILGGPISASSPASVDICMTSLAALYTHYPEQWAYIDATSNGDISELTEKFRQAE